MSLDQLPPQPDLPSPPFIRVEGIYNFRDAGGYPITASDAHPSSSSSPKSVRRKLLYRSADPTAVTPAGKALLTSPTLNLTTVFDLRSKPEIDKQFLNRPVATIPGAVRHFTPIFAEEDYSPENIALRYKDYASPDDDAAGFVRAYSDILEAAPPALATILRWIISTGGREACLIHCSAGKDRTGVVIALLLKIAGVADDVVADEYQLTEKGLEPLKPLFMARLLTSPAIQGDTDKAARMVTARKEAMLRTIAMVGERYGGFEGYVRSQVGLSGEEVGRLRDVLVVDEMPVLMEVPRLV